MKQIRRIVLMAAFGAVVAVTSACTGAGYATTGTVYTEKTYDPYYYDNVTMVPVRENVWVVEGRHRPVFYGSGAYWRYDNGTWYRSRYVDDGYVRVRGTYVPPTIRGIHRPTRYVRYRAPERTRVRVVPPTHFRGRVDVRTRDRGYQDRRYRR